MPETIFSTEELNELLAVLNIALYDADVAIDQSHDTQEVEAYRQHKQTVRKWIHRFSQLVGSDHK